MQQQSHYDLNDLTEIRVKEAKYLKQQANYSAAMVMIVISVTTLLFMIGGQFGRALFWFALAGSLVVTTIVYARLMCADGITRDNVFIYLRGHLVITTITALTWCGFAIYVTDFKSEISVFISSLFLISICLGGMLPGAIYRPAYLVLATCICIPFGTYMVLYGDALIKVYGLSYYAFYAFGFVKSQHSDNAVREGLVSELNKDMAHKIFDQNQEIERLNEEKTRFMASVSHDMSQPLVAQHHFLSSLRSAVNSNDEDAGLQIKNILTNLESVHSNQKLLLGQLSEYARLENAILDVVPQEFALKPLLGHLLSEFEAMAQAKSIRIDSDLSDISMVTDPNILQRIVRNFLSNAVKFTHVGGLVSVTSRLNNDDVEILITDNGIGIDDADQKKIFGEYIRLEHTGDISGLGLGLSIADRLSKLISAHIDLQSKPHKGTQIKLKIARNSAGLVDQNVDTAQAEPIFLVISSESREEFGSWENLLSGWYWRMISSDTPSKGNELFTMLGLMPDLIVLDNVQTHQPNQTALQITRDLFGPLVPIIIIGPANHKAIATDPYVAQLDIAFRTSEFRLLAGKMLDSA